MNINQTLNFIKASAVSCLGKKETAELQHQLSSIRSKQKDKKLYLAVIGEFSSGKSTFINALLGFRLLKEAVTPTTACATYIQKAGNCLSIDVEFFTGAKFEANENVCGFQELAAYLHFQHGRYFPDLRTIVEALTSDQTIAKTVKSLNINVPNANIPENIVIIDTPGFNPGSDDVSNHPEITRHVVENIADAAIILTPQEQAMSATLIRFLQNNLQRYLHRCVFVVTKMDLSDEIDRKEILDFAKNRIQKDLGIAMPMLYGESAITMLPVKCIPFGKEQEWIYFQKDFSWFEHQLWTYLQDSKLAVITEHVYSLTDEVINQCMSQLNGKRDEVEQNKSFLENHSIESIQKVCNEMMLAAQKVVDSSVNTSIEDVPDYLSSAENSSRSYAESTIKEGAITLNLFKENMMPKIKSKVENESQKALSKINDDVNNRVKSDFDDQISVMNEVFSSHYDSFPSLRPQKKLPQANVLKFNTPNLAFSIAVSKIDALEQEENTSAGIGAIAGGILGFIIGGPLGAAAGAAIGGGGGAIAGDKSEEMRKAAIPLVKDEISLYFVSLKAKIRKEIEQVKASCAHSLKDFINAHVSTYGDAIGELIKEHREKIDILNLQIVNLNKSISDLQEIKDEINMELSFLKINNY